MGEDDDADERIDAEDDGVTGLLLVAFKSSRLCVRSYEAWTAGERVWAAVRLAAAVV